MHILHKQPVRRQLPSQARTALACTNQRSGHERVSGSKHLDAVARCRRCKNTGARIQERRDVLRGVEWSALTGAQLQSKCRHLLCGVELCNLLGLHRETGCGNKLHAKSAQHLAGR